MLMLFAQFSTRFAASEVWNRVFPKGEWHGANLAPIGGSITIDEALLAEMVANWRSAGSPPLPIYKTHLHLQDDLKPLERVELEKAYGYLTDFRVTAEGLEARTEWTAAGKATVDAGEFAFWSPEWQPKHKDRRTGETKGWWLSAVALCSDPFFNSMPPVAASQKPTDTTPTKEQHMFTKEQLEALRASLGLKADASAEEILAAATKKGTDESAATITAAVKAHVEPLSAQLKAAQEETAKLSAALLERDVDALVVKAKAGDGKQGRAIPDTVVALAKKLAKSEGLKAATDLLEAIPLSVPMVAAGLTPPPGTGNTLTAAAATAQLDALVAKEMEKGLSFRDAHRTVNRANKALADVAYSTTTTPTEA